MATLPKAPDVLINTWGPHLNRMEGVRVDTGVEPDRIVPTHCCFCGQQCGINLKVKDNLVIGFEPRYDFPFNKGMLCPKGVKRYLQGGHEDRLTTALQRDPDAAAGFSPMAYDAAIARVASEIERIQSTYGPNAFGVLSGASLTTEKAYLMGKFARVCLKTKYIDYNGRLCMVSAGAANKKAFGIDRSANPWDDILNAEVVLVAGSNTAECSPITTNYIWQARENGGKLIVVDPRITPIARNADVFLPVKPGRDVVLFNGILQLMIENDWIDHEFIEQNTVGFEAVAEHVQQWTAKRTAEVTGIAEKSIRAAAELWGTAKTSFLMHARGIEHHSHGVENCLSTINIVLASGRIGKPCCAYGTVVGQGNGQGGREHGQKADQLPGWRDIMNPEHREYIAGVWGVDAADLPEAGVDCYEMMRKIDAGEIKGLLSICFNPKVSLPDNAFVTRALEKLEFFTVIDFFLSETAQHADVVLPGSLHEEDEGVVCQVEGRVIKINKAVDPPGDAKQDWRVIQDIAKALNRPHGFTFDSPRAIFDELRVASRGGNADYYGISYEKIEANNGVFWPCPSEDHPGTPRLFEERFYHPDGKAKFHPVEYNPPAETPDEEYPLILTSGRVVYQYLSGNQTRRIGFLVQQCPEPYVEVHPETAMRLKINDGEHVRVRSRRGEGIFPVLVVRTIRPDTIFIPYHWGEELAVNQLTNPALDPTSKIPEFKACAARIEKIHSRQLPIMGGQRKGASLSEVQRG